ncbi:MAG: flavodoxin family protein, partial [bacterium]
LIVSNCPSTNTRALQDAVVTGARQEVFEGLNIVNLEPLEAGPEEVKWADGFILGTTENFGYMSGLIKDFLERVYYPCLEQTEALPFALFVKGGLDGQGAKTSVERIVTGLRWKHIREPLVMKGDFCDQFVVDCEELGMTMAAGLDAGIY